MLQVSPSEAAVAIVPGTKRVHGLGDGTFNTRPPFVFKFECLRLLSLPSLFEE